MTESGFSNQEAIDRVRSTIEDRGNLFATMLKQMRTAGVENADEIATRAAFELGELDGDRLHDVKTAGELANRLFTPITLDTFAAEITEDEDNRAVVIIRYCPLVVAWRKAGQTPDEINHHCNLANTRDDGLASKLPLNLGFETRIAAGDEYCTFVITKK